MSGTSAHVRKFHKNHLDVFKRCICGDDDPNELGGKNVHAFASGLQNIHRNALIKDRIRRDAVFKLARNHTINTKTVCVAILAWGGMRMSHRDMLFGEKTENWLILAEEIRRGDHDRLSSYNAFCNLKKNNNLPGMGPAYFTKIIYFLMPRSKGKRPIGYIMDQWVGSSINLLCKSRVVLMDSSPSTLGNKKGRIQKPSFTVSNKNDGHSYDEFCTKIEALSNHFGISADKMDRSLLSKGGRVKERWRRYVIEHRSP